MKYWEDMLSKWGFSDGDATPDGAREYRTAYVTAVNALAAKLGSGCRALAFDRGGMHNSRMILIVKAGAVDGWAEGRMTNGELPNTFSDDNIVSAQDAEFSEAVVTLQGYNDIVELPYGPDDCVNVRPVLDKALLNDLVFEIEAAEIEEVSE